MKRKKVLFAFVFLIFLIASSAYSNQQTEVSTEKTFRTSGAGNMTTEIIQKIDMVLPAFITPIKTVYEDCNSNPQKYDIYDGKLIFDTTPCGSGCYIERNLGTGSSMLPTLKNNSYTQIKKSSYSSSTMFDNLSVGEIIVYSPELGQTSGKLNPLHRIVGIETGRAKIVAFENGYQHIAYLEYNESETTILFNNDRQVFVRRPIYVVKGDGNDACEIVPANFVRGVLVSVEG